MFTHEDLVVHSVLETFPFDKFSPTQNWFFEYHIARLASVHYRWSIGHGPHTPTSSLCSLLPPPPPPPLLLIYLFPVVHISRVLSLPDVLRSSSSSVAMLRHPLEMFAWQCCHRTFLECALAKSTLFVVTYLVSWGSKGKSAEKGRNWRGRGRTEV